MLGNKFCIIIFHKLWLATTAQYCVTLFDALALPVIAGHLLGEQGIAAINLLLPLFFLCCAIGCFGNIGTSICYNEQLGLFDNDSANKLFSQGLLASLVAGLTGGILAFWGLEPYLYFVSPSLGVANLVREFVPWYLAYVALLPVGQYLLVMVTDSGDNFVAVPASAVYGLGSVIFPLLLFPNMGTAGLGCGLFLATVSATLLAVTHFFKKTNILRFRFYFHWRKFLECCKAGTDDALCSLYISFTGFILNKFVVEQFSDVYLPVLAVVLAISEFIIFFDAISDAYIPLVGVYIGEGNSIGIRKIMHYSVKFAFVEGVIVGIIFFLMSDFFSPIFGINDAKLAEIVDRLVQIMAFTCPFASLTPFFSSYYLVIDKLSISLLFSALRSLVLYVLFAVAGGFWFGIEGMIIGILLAEIFSLLIGLLYVFYKYGKNRFPFLIDEKDENILSFDFWLDKKHISKMSEILQSQLECLGISTFLVKDVIDFMQKLYKVVQKKNSGITVMVELTFILRGKILSVISRENGEIFNVLEESDLTLDKNCFYNDYLITTNYNRRIFKYKLD